MSRGDGRPQRDWRDLLTDATDLAVLGILLTLAAAPVLTAGAAVATASAAVHDRLATGGWPPVRESLARFGRALLPGLGATVVTLAALGLLALDAAALADGRVPGGGPVLLATALVAAALAGYAGLAVVQVGRAGGRGWRAAARAAAETCRANPGTWAAAGGVVALAALLAVLVTPVAVPILAGYALAALHAVARRAVLVPAVKR